MPVTVVVGGQYGSEGKGKIVSYLSIADDVDCVVRCGGPNAGHTIDYQGRKCLLRQVPSGMVNPRTRLYLAPGSVVNPEILLDELNKYGVDKARLKIDRNAVVITAKEIEHERKLESRRKICSTLSGTGSATSKKVLRNGSVMPAQKHPSLQEFISDVSEAINRAYDEGRRIVVEGTQGFGLSLHHSDDYPYVTSRDTTAAGFLSEAGLSPFCVDEVIMVIRTYPIRVGGKSGPLKNEITWDKVSKRSGYPHPIREYTTVTQRLRRVAEFDFDLVQRAAKFNRPTKIALHGIDYICYEDLGKTQLDDLTLKSKAFIKEIEERIGIPVAFIYTGPKNEAIIDRRAGEHPVYQLTDQLKAVASGTKGG